MADTTTVTIHGLKELSQALQELPKQLRGKALGAAVKAGAKLVEQQARANAKATFKEPTGATEKSIVAYRKRGSYPDSITYEVGVTMKKQWPRRRKRAASGVMGRAGGKSTGKTGGKLNSGAYWWKFTEFGTAKLGATPWLRPAWDYRSGEALAMIKNMLAKAVEIAAQHAPKYTGGG